MSTSTLEQFGSNTNRPLLFIVRLSVGLFVSVFARRPTLFIQDSTQAGYGDDPSKVCPSSLNYIKQRLHILLLN